MKLNNIIFFLTTFIFQYSVAQVSPIKESISRNNFKIYECNNYSEAKELLKNQSLAINTALERSRMEFKYDASFDENFIKNSISTVNYNRLSDSRRPFRVLYIIDQNGNIISCALSIKNNIVTLSNDEVESFLTEALTHKFILSNKPENISNFYRSVYVPFYVRR